MDAISRGWGGTTTGRPMGGCSGAGNTDRYGCWKSASADIAARWVATHYWPGALFFPFGRIVAGDIVPKLQLTGGVRHVRQIDQSSESDLSQLCRDDGPFDIIIDDGSHFNAHQIFTFERIFSALNDNGRYVIEDVQTSFWHGEVMGTVWDGAAISDPMFENSCYSYFLNLAKYINHAEFIDRTGADPYLIDLGRQIVRITFEHNMIVVEKGDNTEVSTLAASVSR